MKTHYNLKEIERRAFRATFQDGLWDIYLGIVFTAFGIGSILRSGLGLSDDSATIVQIGCLIIAMLILLAGKKYITRPRLGHVKFGQQRQRKLSKVRIALTLSVVSGLLVFAALAGDALGQTSLSIVFAANTLIVLGAMVYFLDYDRLFVYAVLWAASFPVGLVLEKHTDLRDAPSVFVATGGLAIVVGSVLLVRFLRTYIPAATEERSNGIA